MSLQLLLHMYICGLLVVLGEKTNVVSVIFSLNFDFLIPIKALGHRSTSAEILLGEVKSSS